MNCKASWSFGRPKALFAEYSVNLNYFAERAAAASKNLRLLNRHLRNLFAFFYFSQLFPLLSIDVCMLTDDTRHIISVEARSTCDLFALSYKMLSDILNEFPDIRPMLEQAALNQLMKITQTVSVNRKFILNVLKAIFFETPLNFTMYLKCPSFVNSKHAEVIIQYSNFLNFLKGYFWDV